MKQLQAGTSRGEITPPIGIAHTNWGAQTHQQAETIDMPLYCTAIVFSDGELEIAIIDLDIIWIMPELDQSIRQAITAQTGIQPQNIRLSYSHTHSGPIVDITWATEGDDLIPTYVAGQLLQPSVIGDRRLEYVVLIFADPALQRNLLPAIQ